MKRGITVAVVASVRDMAGKLLKRERLSFERGAVINYVPDCDEGSVEIEAFAAENLVIPYAAVTALYETARGITMVHSYARSYSRHEVEEGRTITQGEEACWTLRDAPGVRSFAVVHNGPRTMPGQMATLRVTNHAGLVAACAIPLALSPYETVRIVPAEHARGLDFLLDGKPGHASLSFELGEGFTRMLIGHERTDGSDMQVTHSNFDYARHETDALGDEAAFMRVPECGITGKRVLVYPDSAPGGYWAGEPNGQGLHGLGSGRAREIHVDVGTLRFTSQERRMPSRLVTAITGNHGGPALPFECSLGAITRAQPPKRFWWGMCTASSKLVMHDLPEVFGGMPRGAEIVVSLYASTIKGLAARAILLPRDLPRLDEGIPFTDLFLGLERGLDGQPGYYVMTSAYGGLTCYTLTRNEHGSMCLEHGF